MRDQFSDKRQNYGAVAGGGREGTGCTRMDVCISRIHDCANRILAPPAQPREVHARGISAHHVTRSRFSSVARRGRGTDLLGQVGEKPPDFGGEVDDVGGPQFGEDSVGLGPDAEVAVLAREEDPLLVGAPVVLDVHADGLADEA